MPSPADVESSKGSGRRHTELQPGGSDDPRQSLSYKLKRLLSIKARRVLCTDPYVTIDPDLTPLDTVLRDADLLIVATPHPEYAALEPQVPIVDLFNVLGRGVRV